MRNKLLAYALEFTSFLLENRIEPRKVILFGSVVRGEADEESDVDIFVDIDNSEENNIRKVLKIFEETLGERWILKGVSNAISLKVGNLDEWPDLKRSIQSYGILLYGKYAEFPENMKSYLMFRLNFGRMARAKKVSAWRELYGYAQKIGAKKYEKIGIIERIGGRKIEKSVVLVPPERSKEFRGFLAKNKIGFSVDEIWSDSL